MDPYTQSKNNTQSLKPKFPTIPILQSTTFENLTSKKIPPQYKIKKDHPLHKPTPQKQAPYNPPPKTKKHRPQKSHKFTSHNQPKTQHQTKLK